MEASKHHQFGLLKRQWIVFETNSSFIATERCITTIVCMLYPQNDVTDNEPFPFQAVAPCLQVALHYETSQTAASTPLYDQHRRQRLL
jgi:hypothetical protein